MLTKNVRVVHFCVITKAANGALQYLRVVEKKRLLVDQRVAKQSVNVRSVQRPPQPQLFEGNDALYNFKEGHVDSLESRSHVRHILCLLLISCDELKGYEINQFDIVINLNLKMQNLVT